jgi:hypothetical protein
MRKSPETALGPHIEALAEDDSYVQALYGRDGRLDCFVARVPGAGQGVVGKGDAQALNEKAKA